MNKPSIFLSALLMFSIHFISAMQKRSSGEKEREYALVKWLVDMANKIREETHPDGSITLIPEGWLTSYRSIKVTKEPGGQLNAVVCQYSKETPAADPHFMWDELQAKRKELEKNEQ